MLGLCELGGGFEWTTLLVSLAPRTPADRDRQTRLTPSSEDM